MLKNTLLLCGMCLVYMIHAQEVEFIRCATPQAIDYQEKITPGYKEQIDLVFDKSKQWSKNNGRLKTDYVIPVVVHVVYNTPEQNLHDSIILNQIENLNKDFNRLSDDAGNLRPLFNPVVGPSNITFALAWVDENGSPTNGITRTQTNLTTFGSFGALLGNLDDIERVKSTANGGVSPWNQDEYLNIWVCNMSINLLGNETTALLGYATPPDGLPNWPAGAVAGLSDGVVIQYQCFGSNNPNPLPNPDGSGTFLEVLGRTVTHEVGHYLGLRHIWGDGGCTAEDGVDDTPNASGQSNFDCDDTKNTCVDNIPELGGDAPDMIENFMDYSSESCQNAFTLGQIGIMTGVLDNYRPNLGDGNPLSISDKESNTVVYPNPFNELLTIQAEQGEIAEIILFTLDGKVVYNTTLNQSVIEIDTQNFDAGAYILKLVQTNKTESTKKVVKL